MSFECLIHFLSMTSRDALEGVMWQLTTSSMLMVVILKDEEEEEEEEEVDGNDECVGMKPLKVFKSFLISAGLVPRGTDIFLLSNCSFHRARVVGLVQGRSASCNARQRQEQTQTSRWSM